jgi:hypothetical protein
MTETFRFVASLIMPPGTGLARMPILVTGSWVKGGREVSFTRADLDQAVVNFQKLANHDLNVDYDHACEDLERAGGDATPSAGRIVALDDPEEYRGPEMRTGERPDGQRWILYGRYEPTTKARELITNREYRYTSAAFAKEYPDRKSGEPQGLTLTSVALTNQPFLDELPEITLSGAIENLDRQLAASQGGKVMALTIKHSMAADGKHHDEVFDGEKKIGDLDHQELCGYASAHLSATGEVKERLNTARTEAVNLFVKEIGAEGKAKDEIRGLVALAQNPPKAEVTLLCETIGADGNFDTAKFNAGCDSNAISRGAERRGRDAEAQVQKAFLSGHITPAMIATGAPLRLAIADPPAFKTLVEDRPALLKVNTVVGIGGTGSESWETPRQTFSRLVEEKKLQLMQTDVRLGELEAHRKAGALVAKENPDLLKNYRGDAKPI